MKAKRLEDVDGCGSLEQEGVQNDRSCSGSGHGVDSVATSAFPGQPVQKHIPMRKRSNGQANGSVVKSALAMATLFLFRTVVAVVPKKHAHCANLTLSQSGAIYNSCSMVARDLWHPWM